MWSLSAIGLGRQRLILGQCYASELKLLDHPLLLEKIRQQKLLVCLCPHHLEKVEVGAYGAGGS